VAQAVLMAQVVRLVQMVRVAQVAQTVHLAQVVPMVPLVQAVPTVLREPVAQTVHLVQVAMMVFHQICSIIKQIQLTILEILAKRIFYGITPRKLHQHKLISIISQT